MTNHEDDTLPEGLEEEVRKVEIGLRELREAHGWSIKDVTKEIKLSPSIIEAIETEAFDRLPDPIYTRTFIKHYAETVGGDYRPLLLRYDNYRQKNGHGEHRIKERPGQEISRFRRLRMPILLCLCFTVLIGVFFYLLSGGDKGVPEPAPQASGGDVTQGVIPPPTVPVPPPAAPAKQPVVVPAMPPVPPANEAATPPPADQRAAPAVTTGRGTHSMVVTAREWTRLTITVDGEAPFEVLLKPGESLTRKNFEKIIMKVSNAGAVSLTLDGKKLKSLGAEGKSVIVTYPKQQKNRKR